MLVRRKVSKDTSVIQYQEKISKCEKRFNNWIVEKMPEWRTAVTGTNSFNLRHTGVHLTINQSDADCVIMHWVGNDTISIRELGLITKPIVWRLADMWAFSGCKHYSEDFELERLEKYPQNSDKNIDRLIWGRKKKFWNNLNLKVVCGSDWLSSKARSSRLLGKYDTFTIPSSLNTKIFSPNENFNSCFPKERKVSKLLFGANSAITDPRKGFDLLVNALESLKDRRPEIKFELKVFGHSKKETLWFKNIKVESVGYVTDEKDMAKLYNESDLFIIPSRADNLPFTAMESLSCGTPVVGFEVGGIPEIIEHKKNGFLATPFDCHELSEGIAWTLGQLKHKNRNLNANARKKAVTTYSYEAQARSYINLIESII